MNGLTMTIPGRPEMRAPIHEGLCDGQFLGDVAAQHLFLTNQQAIVRVCRTMQPATPDDGPEGACRLTSIIQTPGEEAWEWTDETGLVPMWLCRMVSEIVSSDPSLRVLPDPESPERSIVYRRILPDRLTDSAPAQWAPAGPLRIAYGGDKREEVNGVDSWVRDALLLAGQTISRGCRFITTDGEIRFEYDPAGGGAWYRTDVVDGQVATRRGADSYGCREPGFDRADPTPVEPRDVSKPMTYTAVTGLSGADAHRMAREARSVLAAWTRHSDDSTINLTRSLASMFLRSHPEVCYVYQGPGGTGKSTLAKDLMRHLGEQAMTLSLDLLAQPTAMSAENAMGDLMNHLLALSDDYDPGCRRFERCLPNLKTLLTGLLPFAARRQGENSISGTPQAVHILTTNYHLPLSEEESEQRRFAFATLLDPKVRVTRYRPLVDRFGFWPLMLASAQEWVMRGDSQRRAAAYTSAESLSDTEVEAIRQAIDDGYVEPNQFPGVSWKAIGLIRTTKREKGRAPHSVYQVPPLGHTLYPVWEASARALECIGDTTPHITPMPDLPVDVTCDQWFHRLQELGADPTMFPVLPSKGPDSARIRRHTGDSSWQDGGERLREGVFDDTAPAWGVSLADGYVWLDLDAHRDDMEDGWTVIQKEVGQYGSTTLPRTYAVRTPSGGMHLLYRVDPTLPLKTKAGLSQGVQVDLRCGRGGYVVAAGSHMPTGDYRLVDEPNGGEIPQMSDRLRRWMADHAFIDGEGALAPKPEPEGDAAPARSAERPQEAPQAAADGRKPADLTHINVTPIAEGSRNNDIYHQTFGLLVNHPHDQWDDIIGMVKVRADRSGLSEGETKGIIDSAIRGVNERSGK